VDDDDQIGQNGGDAGQATDGTASPDDDQVVALGSSVRTVYCQTEFAGGGGGHALVVGHDPRQVSAQELSGGQVDGVEGLELRRHEGYRGAQGQRP